MQSQSISPGPSLHRLPNELVLALVERMGAKKIKLAVPPSLIALMSTCWRFRRLILPIVFADTYSRSKLVKATLAGDRTAQQLCTLVTHFWSFHFSDSDRVLVRVLGRFTQLRSLVVSNLRMDEAIVLAVSQLTSLQSLFLSMVTFEESVSASTLLSLKALNVSFFKLLGQSTSISKELLDGLAQAIVSDQLHTLQTSYLELTKSVMQRYLDSQVDIRLGSITLTDMTLNTPENMTLFLQFVHHATHLTDIQFPTTNGQLLPPQGAFGSRVLPRLSKATCLARWASLIVPGRPLAHVELLEAPLRFGEVPTDRPLLITALSHSMGTIEHLFVSLNVLRACGKEMFEGLGSLKELKVDFVVGDQEAVKSRDAFEQETFNVISYIPDTVLVGLKRLVIVVNPRLVLPEVSFDLEFQHSLVQHTAGSLPPGSTLSQCQFASDIWWNKRPNGAWSPYIPESAYWSIKMEMATPAALERLVAVNCQVNDYEGVFSEMYLSDSSNETAQFLLG